MCTSNITPRGVEQFDVSGFVSKFNEMWKQYNVAWISSSSSSSSGGSYSVINSVKTWGMASANKVQAAYADTVNFFEDYGDQLSQCTSDKDFCKRVLRSFTPEKCKYEIPVGKLKAQIDTILNRVETGGASNPLETILKEHEVRIDAIKLPYSKEQKELVDILFLVGPSGDPFPSHKNRLIARSDYWRDNIKGEWKKNPIVKLTHVDSESFLLYLAYVYAKQLPKELSQFCLFIKVLYPFHEPITEDIKSALLVCLESSDTPAVLEFVSALFHGEFADIITRGELDTELIALLMKNELLTITKETVHWMVTRNCIKIKEDALADYVVKWEKAHLPPEGELGDILRACDLNDGTCLGNHLRLCWIPFELLSEKMSVYRQCQSPDVFNKNMELSYKRSMGEVIEALDDFAPLPPRWNWFENVKVSNSGSSKKYSFSSKITLQLSSIKKLSISEPAVLFQSQPFAMGSLLWIIRFEISSNQYRITLQALAIGKSMNATVAYSIKGLDDFFRPTHTWTNGTPSYGYAFYRIGDFFGEDQYPTVNISLTNFTIL